MSTGRSGRLKEPEVALPHTYRVTQYDPNDRDKNGYYVGTLDVISDEGPREAAYLAAVEAFALELGVTHLTVREPRFNHEHTPDEALLPSEHWLARLFGTDLAGFVDGAEVDLAGAQLLVRDMLRDPEQRCWLEAAGRMRVEVGWDMYMFISTGQPCPDAMNTTRASGIFPEPWPTRAEDDDEDDLVRRPVDAQFWAEVDTLVAARSAVLLQEFAAWTRWHRLTPSTPHPQLRRRAAVWVWPDVHPDANAALADIPSDEHVEVAWLSEDGELHVDSLVPEDEPATLRALRAEASGARWWHGTDEDPPPLLEAAQPDEDGIVRARWRHW